MILFTHKNIWIAGFTLIEVLIALVILSIAFTTIFMAISTNTRSFIYIKNKTAATWVASNKIAEIQLGLVNKNELNVPTHTRLFDKEWQAEINLSPTGNPLVSRADMRVGEVNQGPLVTLTTFLLVTP